MTSSVIRRPYSVGDGMDVKGKGREVELELEVEVVIERNEKAHWSSDLPVR